MKAIRVAEGNYILLGKASTIRQARLLHKLIPSNWTEEWALGAGLIVEDIVDPTPDQIALKAKVVRQLLWSVINDAGASVASKEIAQAIIDYVHSLGVMSEYYGRIEDGITLAEFKTLTTLAINATAWTAPQKTARITAANTWLENFYGTF